MAKKVKLVEIDEEKSKDNLTYKKKVVMSIVSLATQEINGIASISRTAVSAISSALNANKSRGIIVEFKEDDKVCIDVFVNVKFGYSVKDVAFRVQENIISSIASMTDFKTDGVNIHVVGVVFNDLESDFVS